MINDLSVTNQKGNLIIGLQKDDFIVTEDGVPQKIEIFSYGENAIIRRSIVLIIDCSPLQGPYFKSSLEAERL